MTLRPKHPRCKNDSFFVFLTSLLKTNSFFVFLTSLLKTKKEFVFRFSFANLKTKKEFVKRFSFANLKTKKEKTVYTRTLLATSTTVSKMGLCNLRNVPAELPERCVSVLKHSYALRMKLILYVYSLILL